MKLGSVALSGWSSVVRRVMEVGREDGEDDRGEVIVTVEEVALESKRTSMHEVKRRIRVMG